MRCQLCLNFSWQAICEDCLFTLLTPTPSKRILEDGFIIYSFYKYSEISKLLHTKHTYNGAKIFSKLSKHAILPFVKTFTQKNIYSIPIDDHVRSGYSHTALIAHELRNYIKPLYGSLRAQNRIRYSGQKLSLRKKESRDFIVTCRENLDVILIDDIITTGATILEAKNILEKMNINVFFAITLADAKEN